MFRVCAAVFADVGASLDVDCWCFFFQAEDGIRDLVRSRGLGDVYKRQMPLRPGKDCAARAATAASALSPVMMQPACAPFSRLSLIHI